MHEVPVILSVLIPEYHRELCIVNGTNLISYTFNTPENIYYITLIDNNLFCNSVVTKAKLPALIYYYTRGV